MLINNLQPHYTAGKHLFALFCFILPWNQREFTLSPIWRNPRDTDNSFLIKNKNKNVKSQWKH